MMSVFPVIAERSDYVSRFDSAHRGVDIFAPRGSAVVAVASGEARKTEGSKQGIGVHLTEPDGTKYFYAHLDSVYGDYPRKVVAGEILGTLGTTGNAQGKEPHVHFELRPQGGEQVDPVPHLQWLGRTPAESDAEGETIPLLIEARAPRARPVSPGFSGFVSSPMGGVLIVLGLYFWMKSNDR